MVESAVILVNDIGLGLEVGTKPFHVSFGILVADRFVRKEAERLMGTHGPTHLFVDIRLDHLGAPITMVAPDETRDRDIVQEASHDDLLTVARISGGGRGPEKIRSPCKSAF